MKPIPYIIHNIGDVSVNAEALFTPFSGNKEETDCGRLLISQQLKLIGICLEADESTALDGGIRWKMFLHVMVKNMGSEFDDGRATPLIFKRCPGKVIRCSEINNSVFTYHIKSFEIRATNTEQSLNWCSIAVIGSEASIRLRSF